MWIWIWMTRFENVNLISVIKIQISCLDNFKKVKDLNLTNPLKILNLKTLEFEIIYKSVEF